METLDEMSVQVRDGFTRLSSLSATHYTKVLDCFCLVQSFSDTVFSTDQSPLQGYKHEVLLYFENA